MRVLTSLVIAVVLPLLVVAHGDDYLQARRHDARQASASTSSPPSSTAPPSATPSISGTIPSSTGSSVTTTSGPVSSISIPPLFSTNPTAVPLASIVANESSLATQAPSTTQAPGATPSYMSAPPLPNLANQANTAWPSLDVVPPIDSPEVLQWIKEVNETGVVIPPDQPTNPGGCINNMPVVNANNTCWWTCSGCVASFDVTTCNDTMTWGLTYDDGPAFHTTELLAYLAQQNLKSTFFLVGSRVREFPIIAQDEYMSGHQIAVHTWSHPYLTTLSNEQIIAELGWSRKIMQETLGVTPNMMRPPYGDIDRRVRAISVAMGLRPVIWTRLSTKVTFDTGDFTLSSNGTTAAQVIINWENILGNATHMNTGFIVLEHDLFEQTVQMAVGYILPDGLAFQPPLKIMPVISCLKMPISNAYVETNDNTSNPPVISSGNDVTIIHPTQTGSAGTSGSSSSGIARPSIGFSPVFIMTVLTLLAGVYVIRF